MKQMKHYCVVSHTHWDREWYLPLESMKLRLCDLMDHCLEILKSQPDYIFHLDAQTVVLEDYLEIRPERRNELEQRIRERRLMVGPWYLQNDFYLTSGESTIRNLLVGRKIAESFGNVDSVGYAPDQFGNISQLPQILKGFGIDSFVFGRGLSKIQPDGTPTPSEFIWEGADGTRILSIFLSCWYNNSQHISPIPQKAKLLLEHLEREFGGVARTPYLLLMNGVDHLEPQPDLLAVLRDLNEQLPDDRQIGQCRLSEYVHQVQEWFAEQGEPKFVYRGELRQGPDTVLLKGTLSSRSYLKVANVKAQTMLENRLEPLYSMLELAGLKGAYSADHFRYMWKQLLRNHPHDSICGCSCDEVHRHMEDNYSRLQTTTEDMLARGMRLAATHLQLPGRTGDNYLIAVANTTQMAMDSVAEVSVDIPKKENAAGIKILDAEGKPAEYLVLSKTDAVRDGFSPLNLPGMIPVDRYKVSLHTGNVQPFALKGFRVETSDLENRIDNSGVQVIETETSFENEYIRLTVHANGTADLLKKQSGRVYPNFLDIEDTGDWGDSYVYVRAENDPPIYASKFPATVRLTRSDRFVQTVEVFRELRIPAGYNEATRRRTPELVSVPVKLTFSLSVGNPYVELAAFIDNRAMDHRMRLLVKSGIISDYSQADIPFDVVSHTDMDHSEDSWTKDLPNATFACLESTESSLAVLTEGTHEYEHIKENGVLAFSLFRSNGIIARNYETMEKSGGDQWVCPDNQCLRCMEFRFAILPYEGKAVEAMIPIYSSQFRTKLSVWYDAGDCRKFMQGRPAVQDSRLEEYYYLPDPFAGKQIPNNQSIVSVSGNALVTALKKSEDDKSIILRLVNLNDSFIQVDIKTNRETVMTSLDEREMEGYGAKNCMRPKEIATFEMR